MSKELDLHASPIDPGLTVIEASAGTGKTYSISHLVPRLLIEGILPDISKLLLVTFTKDAARELSDRVRRVLTLLSEPPTAEELAGTGARDIALMRPPLASPEARARLQRALLDLDLLSVSTIHAFCQRSLQQEGSLCGLPVLPEVVTNDDEYLNPILRRHWISTLSADPVLAALATAKKWDLENARTFINTRRRCLRPLSEPPTSPYLALRDQIDGLRQTLASPDALHGLLAHLGQVTSWNKKSSLEAVTRWLTDFAAQLPAEPSFWTNLADLQSLPAYIKDSKAQKSLRADLPDLPWFKAAQSLQTLAASLQWSWQHHLAECVIPELADFMARHRLITQDGLIGALFHALHRTGDDISVAQSTRLANRLAERYHVALIDESQDTDPRQFAIFKRIFLDASPRRRLLLVGDPKQAIYGFRGADLSTYLAARATTESRYTLSQTRRAPQPLVAVINSLFQRPAAFLNPGMAVTPAVSALDYDHQLYRDGRPCSRLEIWMLPETGPTAQPQRIAYLSEAIARTITDLLSHESELVKTRLSDRTVTSRVHVSPAHFAVLVATHAQAAGMADALQVLGVPAVINSGADVFSTEEASDLHLLLQAILDPRRSGRVRRALATRLLGFDATAIVAADHDQASDHESPARDSLLKRFTQWQELWHRRGLVALFTELEKVDCTNPDDTGVTQRLALIPLTGERRVTNYRQLTDLLLDAARDTAPRPDEQVRWLGQQIARASDRSDAEDRQLQLSSDRHAVQVVTMHKAKGLEYPLVFCPYLADSLKKPRSYEIIPGQSADSDDCLLNIELLDDATKVTRTAQLLSAQLEERLRLAYVALTRAQVRAWTCSYRAHKNHDFGSSLDWLLRGDGELTSHPAYSSAWVELAQKGGTARHEATLASIGAQPAPHDPSLACADFIFCAPPELPPTSYLPADDSAARPNTAMPLQALPPPAVPASWRITSFSTLTREKHAHGAPSLPPPAAAPLTKPTSGGEEQPAPAFASSPAGAAVGTAVHDWLEAWDFSPLAPAADAGSPLARHLDSARLPAPNADQPAWPAALHELFSTLRVIRLPGCDAAPLHTLCADAHGSEWHFYLPLAGSLSVQRLARCFADHAAPEHRSYAPQLAALSEEQFHGLLQGFIDRLARHGDAWGVIDWKTNRLGVSVSDYDQPALLRCAMDSHYLLQTHLYLVALRRYLRSLGLAGAPVAGAWLVFLRAIAPDSSRGVLHIDPPAAMLDALDELFAPATSAPDLSRV